MAEPFLTEPRRWSDEPIGGANGANGASGASGASVERSIGAALRRTRQATEPSPVAARRLAARWNRPAPARRGHRVWRTVLVAFLIMCTGGAVGAALTSWRHIDLAGRLGLRRAATLRADPGHTVHARPARTSARSTDVAVPDPDPAARSATPVPIDSTLAPPSRSPASSPTPTSAPGPSPTPPAEGPRPAVSPPVAAPPSEADALAAAFRDLRSGRDPVATLRLLDRYDRRFPRGALRGEAGVARAEALLALGRRQEALPLLEAVEQNGGALTRDIRITRAELLAERGDCLKAAPDFDALLASSKVDAAAARALLARASCRLREGEIPAARQDLERYLRHYPDGASAAAARRALDSMP